MRFALCPPQLLMSSQLFLPTRHGLTKVPLRRRHSADCRDVIIRRIERDGGTVSNSGTEAGGGHGRLQSEKARTGSCQRCGRDGGDHGGVGRSVAVPGAESRVQTGCGRPGQTAPETVRCACARRLPPRAVAARHSRHVSGHADRAHHRWAVRADGTGRH